MVEICECGHLKSYHVTSIEVSLGCSGVIEHRSPAILNHKPCPCLGYRPPTPEPAHANAHEAARAFKRVAFELRMRFPVEIQYNSEFEAMVKRLEAGSL